MKRLKWLLLIFSATMNTSISGGSLLRKSVFLWFPYLHKTLVAVKEQDVYISRKIHLCTSHDYGGSETAATQKINNKKESHFPCVLFCFEITKVTVVTPKWLLTFIHYVIASKDDLQKISRGLVHWSHVIPVNGSTPPTLVCWVE